MSNIFQIYVRFYIHVFDNLNIKKTVSKNPAILVYIAIQEYSRQC